MNEICRKVWAGYNCRHNEPPKQVLGFTPVLCLFHTPGPGSRSENRLQYLIFS